MKQLTAILDQNGVIPENKTISGKMAGSVQEPELYVPYVFFEKLVDAEDVDMKLHELSLLISHLSQLKVFYTYLNHLRRCKKLIDEDWQRYSVNALHQTSRKISVSDSASIEILEGIISLFRKDGIFVNENIMRSIGINSTSSNMETKLELSEFRVGQILPMGIPQTAKTASGYPVLMHVQALGRSLKELLSAFEARDDNHVAVAVICSILNALSFGGPERFHYGAKLSSVNSVLDEIVDYGDVDHICSVVDRSGNEGLQQVCKEGLYIVDRARTVETNHANSGEEKSGGTQWLVSVMGLLANGVTKLVRETTKVGSDVGAKKLEAVRILALIVTAKMIQMVEPAVELETENSKGTDESKADVKNTFGTEIPAKHVSSTACSPSIVDPKSRSSVASYGRGTNPLQRVVAIEESIASLVEEIKSERVSNKEIYAKMVEVSVEHRRSQEPRPQKLSEIMEKLDNRLGKLEQFLGYTGCVE